MYVSPCEGCMASMCISLSEGGVPSVCVCVCLLVRMKEVWPLCVTESMKEWLLRGTVPKKEVWPLYVCSNKGGVASACLF